MPLSPDDLRFMGLAIELARRCTSEPGKLSPKVGAVVVKGGEVLASAYRGELTAGDHAEFTALEGKVPDLDLSGSTVYTTLEPCTARNAPKIPCANRIIARGVGRVVVGMLDPDPRIAGTGVNVLQLTGVPIDVAPPEHVQALHEMNAQWVAQFTAFRTPWREVASMSVPRERHAAVLLPEGALVIGGAWARAGAGNGAAIECELFDPSTERWRSYPSLRSPRIGHSATLLADGSVFAFGGYGAGGQVHKSGEILSPGGHAWAPIQEEASTPRLGHTATRLNDGRVLICGGYQGTSRGAIYPASMEVFDPASRRWSQISMPIPRDDHTATLLPSGRVLIVGGKTTIRDTFRCVSLLETHLFDPVAGSWSEGPPMNTPRRSHIAVLLRDNRLLVAGGVNECAPLYKTVLKSAETLSLDTFTWTVVGEMQSERELGTLLALSGGGALLAGGRAGGEPGVLAESSERFDPVGRAWAQGPKMNVPRMSHTAVALGKAGVLFAGGVAKGTDGRLAATARVEILQHA